MDVRPYKKPRRVPLWLKLSYSAFVAVLVPYYWRAYGPTNFLYFCDVALLMTLVGVWREDPLWVSLPAVGILFPQLIWIVDFLAGATGVPLTGMTDYMFNPSVSLFTRALSFFHFWLPILLVWLVWQLGYDRRAWFRWACIAWALMFVSYLFLPAPPAPADQPNLPVNIDYVYGLSDAGPQTWMHPTAWFTLMLFMVPVLACWPTHWVLCRYCPPAPSGGNEIAEQPA